MPYAYSDYGPRVDARVMEVNKQRGFAHAVSCEDPGTEYFIHVNNVFPPGWFDGDETNPDSGLLRNLKLKLTPVPCRTGRAAGCSDNQEGLFVIHPFSRRQGTIEEVVSQSSGYVFVRPDPGYECETLDNRDGTVFVSFGEMHPYDAVRVQVGDVIEWHDQILPSRSRVFQPCGTDVIVRWAQIPRQDDDSAQIPRQQVDPADGGGGGGGGGVGQGAGVLDASAQGLPQIDDPIRDAPIEHVMAGLLQNLTEILRRSTPEGTHVSMNIKVGSDSNGVQVEGRGGGVEVVTPAPASSRGRGEVPGNRSRREDSPSQHPRASSRRRRAAFEETGQSEE
jgi:hypothetical protein